MGIVCLIKCSHGKAFPLNSVFLGSVSSLHSCRRDNNYMRDICPFPSKAEINQKFTSCQDDRQGQLHTHTGTAQVFV